MDRTVEAVVAADRWCQCQQSESDHLLTNTTARTPGSISAGRLNTSARSDELWAANPSEQPHRPDQTDQDLLENRPESWTRIWRSSAWLLCPNVRKEKITLFLRFSYSSQPTSDLWPVVLLQCCRQLRLSDWSEICFHHPAEDSEKSDPLMEAGSLRTSSECCNGSFCCSVQ